MSGDVLDNLGKFQGNVRTRMDRGGRKEYGDRSFSLTPQALLREVQQELEDQSGWSFIAWEAIEKQIAILDGLDAEKARSTAECARLEAERNRLLSDIQRLEWQKREAEGTRNHPGPNTIAGCELSAAE